MDPRGTMARAARARPKREDGSGRESSAQWRTSTRSCFPRIRRKTAVLHLGSHAYPAVDTLPISLRFYSGPSQGQDH